MKNKSILLILFILVAAVQLYVPASMIIERESILNSGIEYKFKTVPIDPTDPFRGKYIMLNFENNVIKVENEKDWVRGQQIYVLLTKNSDGFASIKSVSKEKPSNEEEFLSAKVSNISSSGNNKLTIEFPFERFYMEELKAPKAEIMHQRSIRDSSKLTYAIVRIKNGEAVLKDVMIDDIPIHKAIENAHQEK